MASTSLLAAGDGPEGGVLAGQAAALGIGGQVGWLKHLPQAKVERRFDTA